MDSPAIIAVTHSGIFHADEIMALALLKIASGNTHVSVMRSRFSKDWERADYVIDVGGKFDGQKWFDHHQPLGAGKRDNGIPYSSFGLIWNALGITAVRQLLHNNMIQHQITDSEVLYVVDDMESFVAGIDAHDQALLYTLSKFLPNKSINLEIVSLQQIISNANPIPLLEEGNDLNLNKQFETVLNWAEWYLRRFIARKASRVLAKKFVQKYDSGEQVLVLPKYCDWSRYTQQLPHVLFVVHPSLESNTFSVQAVKKGVGSSSVLNLRQPFPEEWAGLTEHDLQIVTGVEDALFCHKDRFMVTAKSINGAIWLANEAIKKNE